MVSLDSLLNLVQVPCTMDLSQDHQEVLEGLRVINSDLELQGIEPHNQSQYIYADLIMCLCKI